MIFSYNCIKSSPYIVPGLLYIIPRSLKYITTKPLNNNTYLNKFRNLANIIANIFIKNFGKDNWDLVMALTIDNAWISYMIIAPIGKITYGLTLKKIVLIGNLYLGVGSIIWLFRLGLTKILDMLEIDDIQSIKPRTEI